MKRLFALLIAVVALISHGALLPSGPPAEAQAAAGAIDPRLFQKVEPAVLKSAIVNRSARVIVELQPVAPPPRTQAAGVSIAEVRASLVTSLQVSTAASQQGVVQLLADRQRAGQVASYRPFWIFNGVAAQLDYATLVDLAGRPDVVRIREDRYRTLVNDFVPPTPVAAGGPPALVGGPLAGTSAVLPARIAETVEPIGPVTAQATATVALKTDEWNLRLIGADRVWNGLGITGRGVVVAIMDTGVDWLHPGLATRYRGYAPKNLTRHTGHWYDSTTEAFAYPGDGVGHGTSVAGVVLGDSPSGAVGVAPGAQWIGVKVFDHTGSSYDSWIHAGFEWLLAPTGDPALAPNVVNASWGKDLIGDATFQPDLRALRAAGIVPVFAAGNYGPNASTLTAPGALPEAFAVGATDNADLIANFSSRGPSPFGVTKPDVVAPGVNVRAPMPGGGYHSVRGTSFASPHVAGLAALIMEAKPGISVADVERAIISGTVRARFDVPSTAAGWGRIDAYSSVVAVASSGSVRGRVTATDGKALPGASVSLKHEASGATISTVAGNDGSFQLALRAGRYQIIAAAFGYQERRDQRIDLAVGGAVTADVVLTAKPRAAVSGRVTDAATGAGVPATVTLASGGWSTTASATGDYTIDVPQGTHRLRVSIERYRAADITVTVGTTAVSGVDFPLARAPKLLVVDSGAWYSDSHLSTWQDALEALGYVHSVRQITDTQRIPTLDELKPYDVVIWSAPQDAPGIIGAQAALTGYLDGGGRLLLSGQDIGFWDGGIHPTTFSPYFRDYLFAEAVWDDAGSQIVSGLAIEPLAGITVTLNTPDSAANQKTPDVSKPRSGRASTVMAYGTATSAALRANVCLPYRALYLAFGWEGSGPRANRLALLESSLSWLSGPDTSAAYQLSLDRDELVVTPGKSGTAGISIWNTTALTETYDLAVRSGKWPATAVDAAGNSITSLAGVGGCGATTGGARVSVPYDAARPDSDEITITVTPRSNPSNAQTQRFAVRPPGLVLLVDDSRFFDVRDRYQQALTDVGLSYDTWSVATAGPPAAQALAEYPIVFWYTGYDWYDPLNAEDEQRLASYLDGGGRLLLSSQDYLYRRGESDFRVDRLGVLTYTADITAFAVSGVVNGVVGAQIGTAPLNPPYPEWSDVITPTASATTQLRNRDGGTIAISRYDATSHGKSFFLAFPFDGLDRRPAGELLRSIVDWFGGLAASSFTAERAWVEAGAEVGFSLTLVNSGLQPASVSVTNDLPSGLRLQAATLRGGTADLKGGVVWSGSIAPGASQVITYRARLEPGFVGTAVSTATIESPGQTPIVLRSSVAVPYRYFGPIVLTGGT